MGAALGASAFSPRPRAAPRKRWTPLRTSRRSPCSSATAPLKTSSLATAMDNVASSLAGVGRFDEADSIYRKVVLLKVEAFGPQNPQTLRRR